MVLIPDIFVTPEACAIPVRHVCGLSKIFIARNRRNNHVNVTVIALKYDQILVTTVCASSALSRPR